MKFDVEWSQEDEFRILSVTSRYGKTDFTEMPPLVQKAIIVATEAHRGQFRKDEKTPYIVHPWCVLKIAIDCEWHFTEEELAAFVLHDVVEDTQWPVQEACKCVNKELFSVNEAQLRARQFQELVKEFDVETTSIVWLLTKPVGHECRRKIYRTSLRRVAPSVIAGKLADALHNLSDLPTGIVSSALKQCPKCGGDGKQSYPQFKCIQCGGSGKVPMAFDEYFKQKVREDVLPLIPILRMHGNMWESIANWFESRIMRLL